jgi:PAS domain S-box-containing protein
MAPRPPRRTTETRIRRSDARRADTKGRARGRGPEPDELRREHDLLSRLMDTSPAGIVRLDREGRILFANGRAEQVLRLARRDIGARTYDDPQWRITDYDGGTFEPERLPFHVVRRTGRAVYDVRHAIEPADGPRVLLSINAAPLLDERGGFDGVVATVEDVTERVRAEQALRETTARLERSESRYRFFMENLPGIAYQFDARHDRPVFFHGAVEEITGYRSADFLEGRIRWDQMVHPDDRAVFAGEARKLSGEPPRIADHEYRILRRDGAVRWVDVTSAGGTIRDGPGNGLV